MKRLIVFALMASLFVLVGCASKIEGETATPPPAGGPGASAKHPPGLSQGEIDSSNRR